MYEVTQRISFAKLKQVKLNLAGDAICQTFFEVIPVVRSLETLNKTVSVLDAIEMGIRVVEADPSVDSVGVGGAPNANGVVQLDACIMDGATHRVGTDAEYEIAVVTTESARLEKPFLVV